MEAANSTTLAFEETASRLAALAHPARLQILTHLSRQRACCCRDVVEHFDLAQSTVSQHLRVLVDAGLVSFETDRRQSRYAVNAQAISALSAEVQNLLACCRGDA